MYCFQIDLITASSNDNEKTAVKPILHQHLFKSLLLAHSLPTLWKTSAQKNPRKIPQVSKTNY